MDALQLAIEGGAIRGALSGDGETRIFRGVPFAAPPVGALRWRPPQPVMPWEGVRDCLDFAPMPVQLVAEDSYSVRERGTGFSSAMSEDCLYLNVWTPAKAGEKPLPVLFWIYGGGFTGGSTSFPQFDGEGFAKNGVIMVTPAYRTGPLGYMAHPELSAESERGVSGNYGVLDLIAALKWTRRNIAAFGGDPEAITVGGQSAGGGSTHTLCCSPLTRGDIRRALLHHSGGIRENSFLRYLTPAEAERIGVATLENLGVKTIAEAREAPWRKLFEANFKVPARENLQNLPVIDGWVLEYALTESVLRDLHHDIDYMVGHTVPGGILPIAIDKSADMGAFRANAREVYGEHAEEYLRVCNVKTPEELYRLKLKLYHENMLSGDLNFCEEQLRLGRRPAYLFEFTRTLPGDDSGTLVGCEHWFLFKTLQRSWRPFNEADYRLSDTMSRYWSNFIRSGDPNGEGLPEWPSYTAETRVTMEFGNELSAHPVEFNDILSFRRDFVLGELDR